MAPLHIRRAGQGDASLVARIHLAAWRATYARLVPDEAAAGACAERSARWRASFADPESADAVFLAARRGEEPAGFSACGPVDNPKLARAGFRGEIYAVYLLPGLQRQGAGRLLMQAASRHLVSRGILDAGVWVLRDNAGARGFYEALGARETGIEGVWPVLDMKLPDLAYGWRDLSALSDRAQSRDR
jgi:ribosomal protein S18 acetylase RimI-like enzyme